VKVEPGRVSLREITGQTVPGCPEPFYLGLGFRHAGRVDGSGIGLELPLG
jgi:hypothetical protein